MKKVFLSHSGADSEHAKEIANLLKDVNIDVQLDRKMLRIGDSFLTFMEDALSSADYCLLLWSKDASEKSWVRAEWEAALYKSIQESRSFIVVGRLEPYPVPSLLAPRLMVELYPEYDNGLSQLVSMWSDDINAEAVSFKPVKRNQALQKVENGLETIYISSSLFGKTSPVNLNFEEPVVMLIDRIIKSLDLPMEENIKNAIRVHFDYELEHNNVILNKSASLLKQGVQPKDVIWLQTKITYNSSTAPVHTEGNINIFRTAGVPGIDDLNIQAKSILLGAIYRTGLGFE